MAVAVRSMFAFDMRPARKVATGLPFGVLARPLGYIADVEQGKVEPANAADYARGLITGKGNQQ